jgi:hypothetical protein
MDELARPLANTGRDQRVFFGRLLAQTYFAAACEWHFDAVVASVELQVRGLLVHVGGVLVADFEHDILNPAQTHHISRCCDMRKGVPNGYPSTPSSFWKLFMTRKLLWKISGWSFLTMGCGSTPLTVADWIL